MADAAVGQTIDCAVRFLDQNGLPMVITPPLDAPPLWSHLNAAVDELDTSGLTATDQALTPGVDTISVSVSVHGS